MKGVSRWKHEYPPDEAEWATVLRRAIFVAPARVYDPPFGRKAGEMGEFRRGVCYNYQEPQIDESVPLFDKRDFSMSGRIPLEDIDHKTDFSLMKEAS